MRNFFGVRNATDPLYRFLAGDAERSRRVQELWEGVEPYVDTRRPQAAAVDFNSTFWEMYLAAALLRAGVSLVPRSGRRSNDGGPDLEAKPTTWIEAILATGGKSDERVVEAAATDLSIGASAAWVPDEKLLVRIETALRTKREKYVDYRNRDIVRDGEPYVIAVSGGSMPFRAIDTDIPRVVRTVFGLGQLTVTVDVQTATVVKEEYPPLLSVKSGRNDVLLALFARPEYAFVSAIVWGSADVLNQPSIIGRDLIVVRNPNAVAPLPQGWFRQGREYWVEESKLREHHWWRSAN